MSAPAYRLLSGGLWLLSKLESRQDHYGLFGDLEEYYRSKAATDRRAADLWFMGQLLKLLPAMLFYRLFWAGVMIKNYGRLGIRNLIKHYNTSVINIVGLAVAIGLSLISFCFMDFFYSLDTHYENHKKIFLVGNIIEDQGREQFWGNGPEPLGPALAREMPQVSRAVRIANDYAILRRGDQVNNEFVRFADADYLNLFTHELKYGRRDALSDPNSVVLNEDLAWKYFGDTDPVGQSIEIKFQNGYSQAYTVGAVAAKFDKRCSFGFNVLLPYEKQLQRGFDHLDDWGRLIKATFVELNQPEDAAAVEQALGSYLDLHNAANPDRPMKALKLQALAQMPRTAYQTRDSIVYIRLYPGQLYSTVVGSIIFLLQACFNFMNISIVASSRRFKEIAVRKIMGSGKAQLIAQFVGENVVICFVALVLGVVLGANFFVPGFNRLWGVFQFDVDILGNPRLLAYLFSLLLLTGVGAGLYPAFYIAGYDPVNILRRKQQMRGNNFFVKGLLVLQFTFAILAVANGFVFMKNNEYQRNRDWGYNQAQRLTLPVGNESQYTQMFDAMKDEPGVLSMGGAQQHIGVNWGHMGIKVLEETHDVVSFNVGDNYFQTMGLRLASGRSFHKESAQDREASVLVNETLVRKLGWQNPLEQRIEVRGQLKNVVGVVNDFHYDIFMHEIDPVVMELADRNAMRFLVIETEPGSATAVNEILKARWQQHFPDDPFTGIFQDQVFAEYINAMESLAKSSTTNAVLALVIACMGILGLVSLDIARRMKEISIRKVLGAGHINVAVLINRGFFQVILIAALLAVPSGYFLFNLFLDSLWKYHHELSPMPFALALAVVLAAAFGTVLSHIIRALSANPINALRDE